MLKGKLIHPQILEALGMAGHGSKVLIADGNYPFATRSSPLAKKVFLNLSPGMVKVTDVLHALMAAIPIETAQVMVPDDGPEPPIFAEFRAILPDDLDLATLRRLEFYDAASDKDVALLIATGEQRVYANLLLTIGVVTP